MLAVHHIDVCYGDLQALRDVSLTINTGEIVALVGSNGAGKSTLMKAIAGLLPLRTGSVVFDGTRIDTLPPHRIVELGLSMVPEGRRIFPQMSVLENLEVGASVRPARSMRQETIEEVYDMFPVLKQRTAQKAGTLSGGEQQMLAIGTALMSRPKVLLIDEMSLGLSPLFVQELSSILREINRSRSLTIFLVEQDVQLALSMAHRGYVMENGYLIDEGDASSLLCSDRIREAYLGML